MIYRVRARIVTERAAAFFEKLTDGTIENQEPDGREIVASMKRAVITEPGVVEWYEACYCSTPLLHERETQYDHFFTDMTTEEVDDYGSIEGESFWSYLEATSS